MDGSFFKKGLNFECTRCSKCCRHDPGYVFISQNDLKKLSEKLFLSEEKFIEKFCRSVDMGGHKRLSLLEKKNYDCIFWEEKGCTVYDARPLQCRSYPFWKPILQSEQSWNREAESCPGINKGRLVESSEIEKWLEIRDNEPYISL